MQVSVDRQAHSGSPSIHTWCLTGMEPAFTARGVEGTGAAHLTRYGARTFGRKVRDALRAPAGVAVAQAAMTEDALRCAAGPVGTHTGSCGRWSGRVMSFMPTMRAGAMVTSRCA